ncbi:glycosyltransferase family 4 protein [Flavobacterium sp. DG2-3]|uniref:glycosyltransferase family 4 protein n=1 Tax=Flavobacterium sp. DG2-3 TaxID=3068317 RepID=UPI00273CF9CC|nr:glycosyltransferase family 4 protein [Flavobacterium sp. DG2-3]MDP5200679.1 glycosyltransferase family 4 protein [Flavobacterium sp. DG2-3]
MKILMVSIPNHHFFQWVNQLRDAGHEVYWFDISDSSTTSERTKWLKQIRNWKTKWDFPGRKMLKKYFPEIYKIIQQYNERKVEVYFNELLHQIQPNIVHSFAMQLSCVPILDVMKQHPKIKWIYSSWGSDIFLHETLGITKDKFTEVLQRVDYLITDCRRDYNITLENGFKNKFLGAFIGNGGLEINEKFILDSDQRNIFLIKGYEDGIGKTLQIIDAVELLPKELFENLKIVIYSADLVVKERVEKSEYFKNLKVRMYLRGQFVSNDVLLEIMGKSILHVANSVSDGLPTAGIEAMGMGAFPIQTNPGNVSEEVITHGVNGYLIENPFDVQKIALNLQNALKNATLRETAKQYNVTFVDKNFNRDRLKKQIIKLYESIGQESN